MRLGKLPIGQRRPMQLESQMVGIETERSGGIDQPPYVDLLVVLKPMLEGDTRRASARNV
jgi:hypothetical protein